MATDVVLSCHIERVKLLEKKHPIDLKTLSRRILPFYKSDENRSASSSRLLSNLRSIKHAGDVFPIVQRRRPSQSALTYRARVFSMIRILHNEEKPSINSL